MIPDARPIAVVGAGIGGLAAALLLSRAGFPVTLIERRIQVEEEGAGLQLSPNASRILIDAGLGPALARSAGAPERVRIRRAKDGREIATIPLGQRARERYGAPYLVIHRADLASVLLDAVRGEERIRLICGRDALRAISSESADSIVLISRGERGTSHELQAAAVIAADGLWGRLAPGNDPPRFSGYAAWRALVPTASAPSFARANEVGLWLAAHAHLVHYPVRDGDCVNIVAVLKEQIPQEGWSRQGEAGAVRAAFADCDAAARDLVASAPDWRSWSLFDRKPRRRWSAGLMTLLGDAAHPMLPFLAQGAAMAIEDAAELARELALPPHGGPCDVAAALRRYEQARRDRTARAQREARRNLFAYHASWPVAAARDLILSKSSSETLLARYDWLYGWRMR